MLTAPILALALLAAPPAKVALPPYVVEAPDILRVEVTGLPKAMAKSLPAAGNFIIRPDGTVALGDFGSVSVAGMTTGEVTEAVTKLVGADLNKKAKRKLAVKVAVSTNNSKFYYVVTDNAGRGEDVTRFPCTGSETVLDAVSRFGRVPGNLWIVRPNPKTGEQVLPVDWRGITENGVTATNYQLMPGDRLYIKAKPTK